VCGVSDQAGLPRQHGRPFRLGFARMVKQHGEEPDLPDVRLSAPELGVGAAHRGAGEMRAPERERGRGAVPFSIPGASPPHPDYAALVRLPLWLCALPIPVLGLTARSRTSSTTRNEELSTHVLRKNRSSPEKQDQWRQARARAWISGTK
jgi:hypothetical protein